MGITQTQHLQKVILMIAKDIDKLCMENGIEYYLFGGTALGAKRHGGFIPWDDDLDIVLLPEYYDKFITLCKNELNKNKYKLQEGGKDWPEHFSKIRLKGTHIKEIGQYYIDEESDGIYVDVFRVDYASNSKFGRMIQYYWGKLLLSYNMSLKGYKPDSLAKRLMNCLAKSMRIRLIRNFVSSQYFKYNQTPTNWISDVLGRTRYHSAYVTRDVYGKPTYIKFEDTELPAHEKIEEYLKTTFGDYMVLPPEDKRVGLHIQSIDFGNY